MVIAHSSAPWHKILEGTVGGSLKITVPQIIQSSWMTIFLSIETSNETHGDLGYPLVNVYIAIENHHFFLLVNQLFLWLFSIAMSFVYQAGYPHFKRNLQKWWINQAISHQKLLPAHFSLSTTARSSGSPWRRWLRNAATS